MIQFKESIGTASVHAQDKFSVSYFVGICNIFILFYFVLIEDYALPRIYDCATLRHPTLYGTSL
jgi:hypothetical protein